MAWPDEVTAFRTETLTSKTPGLSGADWIGAYPQEGLVLSNGQPADTVMKQLQALREAGAGKATENLLGVVVLSRAQAEAVVLALSEKGAASGVATLGADSKVPATQLRKIDTGTGLAGGGDQSQDRTLALANTAVTPGTYARATVEVDQQGRVVSISEGAAGAIADATETEKGAVEFATAAEIETGAAGVLVPSAARLKADLDRREAQEAWITPSLTSGWVAFGPPYDTAQYYKDRLGRVHLRGTVKSGTVSESATIFTLPAGIPPQSREPFSPSVGGTSAGRVDVLPDGRVFPIAGVNSYFSLSGISFRVA